MTSWRQSFRRRAGLIGLIGIGIAFPCLGPAPARAAEAANDLREASSPFLRAHADSPVAWQRWNEATLARARQEGKPLFVAIGSVSSELSRAMNQQSFSRPETAALMNENFVCVLVDREEQPAVAALAQAYVRDIKQLEGWPVNLWLTPEGRPIDGATYLPPSEEWGKEGFPNAIKRIVQAWKTAPETLRSQADEAVERMREAQAPLESLPALEAVEIERALADGAEAWRARFDEANGGFGDPPKRLEPELLRFLLRDPASRESAVSTLVAILGGAVRDPLDGGFFRHGSDAQWRQPYLQKTLADQARMALALMDAASLDAKERQRFTAAARGALAYVESTLASPEGGFIAGEDATPEGSADFYFWTLAEVRDVLGGDAEEFCRAYGITAEGNLGEDAYPGMDTKGKNLPRRTTPPGDAAAEDRLASAAKRLREHRAKRKAPERDDRATSGAHGLLLEAFSRGVAAWQDDDLRAAARRLAEFIRAGLIRDDGGLRRIAGRDFPAAPEDYAHVAAGLSAYAAATGESWARDLAARLRREIATRFLDREVGRFFAMTEPLAPGLWLRVLEPWPKAGEGPSAEAVVLTSLAGEKELAPEDRELRDLLARSITAEIGRSPEAPPGGLLLALSLAHAAH